MPALLASVGQRQIRAECVPDNFPTTISLFLPDTEPLATVGHHFASFWVGRSVGQGALRIAEITGLSHIQVGELALDGKKTGRRKIASHTP